VLFGLMKEAGGFFETSVISTEQDGVGNVEIVILLIMEGKSYLPQSNDILYTQETAQSP
jgi:hypothetical protein